MINNLLLVGAGNMGKEYAKVLKALAVPFIAVGRGEASAAEFENVTGQKPVCGGVKQYLKNVVNIPENAIVAVNIPSLHETCILLLHAGIKKILVEKPGALYKRELEDILRVASEHKAEVFIAYNRRFYASVIAAARIISGDGGVDSFQFEFTEWSHKIEPLKKDEIEKERWFLSNSSHVADLAFFLGGQPSSLSSYTSGSLRWHSSGAVFCGSGVTENGALYSYSANWDGPGRWGVDLQTKNTRIILRPLEKLQIQKKGSIAIEMADIDDSFDTDFKPGLYRMVSAFLGDDRSSLCTLEEQIKAFEYYMKIANYR